MPRVSDSPPQILLGVSGGIAAYKAAELIRLMTTRGWRVQVVMTAASQQFMRPLTFAALSGQKVITGLFSEASPEATLDSAIEHIDVAQRSELLLIAPATADIVAKLAHGLADDFLTTAYLAFSGPVVIAPAMNVNMWNHPATQANLQTLRGRGVRIVEPDAGDLACGMAGPGRLAVLDKIVDAAGEVLAPQTTPQDLAGETILITAGPTHEPLDPVRYISNRSSGRMGYALAEEAAARGARVTVVSGPVALAPPSGCEVEPVETAQQMYEAVMRRLPEAAIAILAAAVADYRPAQAAKEKIKKSDALRTLELDATPDILAEVGRRKGGRVLVGFAAETGNLLGNARQKLLAKNCDLLVANPVGAHAEGAGFDSATNRGWLLAADGEVEEIPLVAKREMARRILDRVVALRQMTRVS